MLAGVGKPDNHPVGIMFEIRVEGFGDGWPLAPCPVNCMDWCAQSLYGSHRGLLCQCLRNFTRGRVPTVCAGWWDITAARSIQDQERTGLAGTETKQEQQLTAFCWTQFCDSFYAPTRGCFSKNRDERYLDKDEMPCASLFLLTGPLSSLGFATTSSYKALCCRSVFVSYDV